MLHQAGEFEIEAGAAAGGHGAAQHAAEAVHARRRHGGLMMGEQQFEQCTFRAPVLVEDLFVSFGVKADQEGRTCLYGGGA